MMGASAFVAAAVLLQLTAALPVEDSVPIRSPSAGGSLDQSAESSEISSVNVPAPQASNREVYSQLNDPEAAATRSVTDHSIELQGGHQTFFPSFASLFEPRQQQLRLGYGNQEGAYSQRPSSYRSLLNHPLFGGYRNLENFGKQSAPAALIDASSSILGSGNFGVIKGGTFFGQNEGESDFSDGFSDYYENGHGRPALTLGYSANPRPNHNQDQFANFRDFADINTPSSAYSHFVVVYANKNATIDEVGDDKKKMLAEPKNIIETLELLDDETVEVTTRQPKLSKTKAKLAKTRIVNKKEQWKKFNSKSQSHKPELEEPLLALS